MSDADYYADEHGFESSTRGICRSAQATLKAIAVHATWEREAGWLASIDFDTFRVTIKDSEPSANGEA